MSKFFQRTQKASDAPAIAASQPIDGLNVDKLLENINRGVDDQLAGLEAAPPEVRVASALDAVQAQVEAQVHAGPTVITKPTPDVVEFPSNGYRLVRISRDPRRLFFPEDEITPTPPALEAYRSFRTRVLRLQARRQFRTVAITSSAKGDGKTLTSSNLALCFSQLPEYPVLLIDGDLRTHGASRALGHDDGPGLSEVLSGRVHREEAVVATDVHNLHFVCAGDAMKPPPELFSGSAWKEFITWCKDSFKLVLVDCPPALPLADFELISASCDGILVIARARATQKEALERVLAQVDSHKLLGVTLNSVAQYDHSYYYYDYGDRRR